MLEDPNPPKISKLFAEFGVRLFALVLDLFAVGILASVIIGKVLAPLGLENDLFRFALLVAAFLYFAGSWASPLKATPGQLLVGIRVVSLQGEPLSFLRAALRSIFLAALLVATWAIVDMPTRWWLFSLSLAGYAAVFLAAVTPNRQALHDIVARSIVVTRKSLDSPGSRDVLLAHVADSDPKTFSQRRPPVLRTIVDAVVLSVPAFMLFSTGQIMYDRDLMWRTHYAYNATYDLRTAVGMYYRQYEKWPSAGTDLGVAARANYPDGGYHELQKNGTIRISFEVLPELTRGTIVLTPNVTDTKIEWKCHQEGEIERNHLPPACRGPK